MRFFYDWSPKLTGIPTPLGCTFKSRNITCKYVCLSKAVLNLFIAEKLKLCMYYVRPKPAKTELIGRTPKLRHGLKEFF